MREDREPPDVPEDVLAPLYTSVGHLVVNWAMLEQTLEFWVAVVYHDAGGRILDAELPRNFGRKVTFLRKRFSDIPKLAPFKEEGMRLLAEIKALGSIRDHIVHGAISKYDPDGHKLIFVKLDVVDKNTNQQQNRLVISAQELLNAGTRAVGLTADCHKFCKRLIHAFQA